MLNQFIFLMFLTAFSYGSTSHYFIHRYGEICSDSKCELISISASCLRYNDIYIDNEKKIVCTISKATLSIKKDGLCSFSVSPFGIIEGSNRRSDENLTAYPYYLKFENDNAYFCSRHNLKECPLRVDFKNGIISGSAGKVYKKSIDAKNCNKFTSEEDE